MDNNVEGLISLATVAENGLTGQMLSAVKLVAFTINANDIEFTCNYRGQVMGIQTRRYENARPINTGRHIGGPCKFEERAHISVYITDRDLQDKLNESEKYFKREVLINPEAAVVALLLM